MTAYAPTEWSDLFVATAGASAALAGLVFVAVSINLERILKYRGLPERALETLMMLIGVLIISVAGLIPGQGSTALGLELLAINVILALTIIRLPVAPPTTPGREAPYAVQSRWVIRLAGPIVLLIGSISVLVTAGGGLYWIVAGMVFAVVGAVINAWVLLVEILR